MNQPDSKSELSLLTVKQAASCLCCSQANLYSLIERGELPVVQIGVHKGYRIDRRDLELFIEGRKFRYRSEAQPIPKGTLKHLRC